MFYYLLAGCNKPLYDEIDLKPVSGFNYLNQVTGITIVRIFCVT